MFRNQKLSSSHNDVLFSDLNEKEAEIITGGVKSFTIKNTIDRSIIYEIDNAEYTQRPNSTIKWVTNGRGEIVFDASFAPGFQRRSWTLTNLSTNEFQYNLSTWDTQDFDIYKIV